MAHGNIFQRSIMFKIILSLVLTVTVIIGTFRAYEYSLEKASLMAQLERSSEGKVVRLVENLVLPLWEVDERWVEGIILTEMQDVQTYAISVTGEGNLAVKKARDAHWQIIDVNAEALGESRENFLVYQRDVLRAGETIGTVTLLVSDSFVLAELDGRVFRDLLSAIVLIGLLSITLLIMLNSTIIVPLKQLLQASQVISKGEYTHKVELASQDEFAALGDGFNTMNHHIRERENDLRSALLLLGQKSQKLTLANAQMEQDIGELEAAKKSLDKWHNIFLNAGWGVVAGLDTMDVMNPEFAQMHGYEIDELVGQPASFVFSPQAQKLLPDIIKRIHTEGSLTFQSEHMCKDGTTFPVEINSTAVKDEDGQILYRAVSVQDITERTRLQAMMMQTEKMLSVGGLAAGMAHEINNPLSAILQGIQNIGRRLTMDLPGNLKVAEDLGLDFDKMQEYLQRRRIREFLDAITESGDRASNIIINMLSFARRSSNVMQPVNLADLIDEVLTLAGLDYDLKKKYDFKSIELHREFSPDMPDVPCVRSEIQQVLLNLVTNAAHAFQAGGEMTDRPQISLHLKQVGNMAVIEAVDNGPGMPEEVRSRVFEPFFTTKAPGKGTGLGLSVAYYIICDEHAGSMAVESEPGQGTTFKVMLPLQQEQNE